MYVLLPYLWMTFMAGLVVMTIVMAIVGRPRRAKKAEPAQEQSASDPLQEEAEPSLDFGDELAQMNK